MNERRTKSALYGYLEGYVGTTAESSQNSAIEDLCHEITDSGVVSWVGIYHVVDKYYSNIIDIKMLFNTINTTQSQRKSQSQIIDRKVSILSSRLCHFARVSHEYSDKYHSGISYSEDIIKRLGKDLKREEIKDFRPLWEGKVS